MSAGSLFSLCPQKRLTVAVVSGSPLMENSKTMCRPPSCHLWDRSCESTSGVSTIKILVFSAVALAA